MTNEQGQPAAEQATGEGHDKIAERLRQAVETV